MKTQLVGNENYAAQVVRMKNPRKHGNADRLLCWSVGGNNVITDTTTSEGDLRLYFPPECQVSDTILKAFNMYSTAESNQDTTKKGYISSNRRVKTVKLRGEPSIGMVLPLDCLSVFGDYSKLKEGDLFDTLNGNLVCNKYVSQKQQRSEANRAKQQGKSTKKQSRMIAGQFRFHIDTPQLRHNYHNFKAGDVLTITYKLHGTSIVIGNLLTKKKLSTLQKIKKFLGFKVSETEYDVLYSSRKVLKNDYEKVHNHYYFVDVWGEVFNRVSTKVEEGITLYGEVVGFMSSGQPIQKGYDYNCEEKTNKLYVYRITKTSATGEVIEFSTFQTQQYCIEHDLNFVPILETFILPEDMTDETILELRKKYNEKDCYMCKNPVPEEGIVIRKENVGIHEICVAKLKSFRFLELETKMLDEEVTDIEETQEEPELQLA